MPLQPHQLAQLVGFVELHGLCQHGSAGALALLAARQHDAEHRGVRSRQRRHQPGLGLVAKGRRLGAAVGEKPLDGHPVEEVLGAELVVELLSAALLLRIVRKPTKEQLAKCKLAFRLALGAAQLEAARAGHHEPVGRLARPPRSRQLQGRLQPGAALLPQP